MLNSIYLILLLVVMLCSGCALPTLKSITSYLESEEISEIEVFYQKMYYEKYEPIGYYDTFGVKMPFTGGEVKDKAIEFSFNENEITDSLRHCFISFIKQSMFLGEAVATSHLSESKKLLHDMDSTFISFRVTFKNTTILKLSYNYTNYSTYNKNEISDDCLLCIYKPNPKINQWLLPYHFWTEYHTDSHYVKASLIQGDVITLFNKLATLYNRSSADSTQKIVLLPLPVRIK